MLLRHNQTAVHLERMSGLKPLSSPAKNATPAAISLGSTGRPIGISLAAAAQASGEYLLITRFVAVLPGAITLTCIPKEATSNAKDFEKSNDAGFGCRIRRSFCASGEPDIR